MKPDNGVIQQYKEAIQDLHRRKVALRPFDTKEAKIIDLLYDTHIVRLGEVALEKHASFDLPGLVGASLQELETDLEMIKREDWRWFNSSQNRYRWFKSL